MQSKEHWEHVYANRPAEAVSWFQPGSPDEGGRPESGKPVARSWRPFPDSAALHPGYAATRISPAARDRCASPASHARNAATAGRCATAADTASSYA